MDYLYSSSSHFSIHTAMAIFPLTKCPEHAWHQPYLTLLLSFFLHASHPTPGKPYSFYFCMRYLECSDSQKQNRMNGSCQGLEGEETGELLFSKYRILVLHDDKSAVSLDEAEQNRCPHETEQEDQQWSAAGCQSRSRTKRTSIHECGGLGCPQGAGGRGGGARGSSLIRDFGGWVRWQWHPHGGFQKEQQ